MKAVLLPWSLVCVSCIGVSPCVQPIPSEPGHAELARVESVPDARIAAVDAVFAEWDRADSPGCALGIIEDGRLVHARGFGAANLELGASITPTSVFDIGSTSKQFTAACVALLAIDGRLSLEDDVRKFVPELPDLKRTITLRHLLNHTSGIRDYLGLFALAGIETEDFTTKEQALATLARQMHLNFEPGSEFLYSNSGYFLLSIVVERVSGKTLPQFALERLFVPLGMGDTHIHDDHTRIVPRRAQGYGEREDGSFGIDMSDFEQTGDGAVMTTIEDLARWDANFYDARVGGRALLDSLHTRGKLNDGHQLSYALGLMMGRYRGLATVSHGGAWAGYRAQLLRFPERRVSIVCLCNLGTMNPSKLCQRVADVWLAAELEPRTDEVTTPTTSGVERKSGYRARAADLTELRGLYENSEVAARYEISSEGRTARIGVMGKPSVPLVAVDYDMFEAAGLGLRVLRDEAGAITGFAVDAGRVRDLFFERVR